MMYDVFIIVTLPLLWLTLNIFSFFIIFLYELGHAIPALIFTRKTVSIYIGTYGDNSSKKLKAGHLSIYIKPKFAYLRQNGLSIYDTGMPFGKQALTLLGGPVISVTLICLLVVEICFSVEGIYTILVLGIALIIVLLNLAINLFPRMLSVKSSKRLHYSDGYQLILMMEDKNNYANLMSACRFYDDGEHDKALSYLEKTDTKYMEASIFSLMLSCYIYLKQFDRAKKLQHEHENAKWQESITADDYYLLGYADVQLKQYTQALVNFHKAISLKPDHFYSHEGRAFAYNALKDYVLAKEEAAKAIFIRENSSKAFSTRAYASFMLGKTGEAFNDAEKALALDEDNPYALLVMGMYLADKGKPEKALDFFEQAKLLDPGMLYVDEQFARIKPGKQNAPLKTKSKSG